MPQDRELETLDTESLLRRLIKDHAAYHAQYQANWEEVMAKLKKVPETPHGISFTDVLLDTCKSGSAEYSGKRGVATGMLQSLAAQSENAYTC